MKTKGLCFETALSMRTEPADLVLADTSRYGSDGAFRGAGQPNWVREPSGLWVLDFNPANPDYVEIPADQTQLNFTSEDFSLVARFKIDDLTASRYLFVRGSSALDGWYIYIHSAGYVRVYTNQTPANQESLSSAGAIVAGLWYTVGFSRAGASIRIYINGVDDTDTAGVHINPLTSARTAKIGARDDFAQALDGKIAYLGIWNYALSAGQHLKKHTMLSRLVG